MNNKRRQRMCNMNGHATPAPAAAANALESEEILDAAADEAIAACDGDAREAVKALIVANRFLEAELGVLQAAVSRGYARGRKVARDMAARKP
jgi:hypothetical protein